MNNDKRLDRSSPEIIFLSFFWVGFMPIAPGTWGTASILPFLFVIGKLNPPFIFFIPFIVIMTLVSSFMAESVQRKYELHDPQFIVIDEVLGMMTAWLFIKDHQLSHLILLFLLFRFFDIVKIWPASFFDRKIAHGSGTILDDIVSGLYAGITYIFLIRVMLPFLSVDF